MLPRDQSAMRVAYWQGVRDRLVLERKLEAVTKERDALRAAAASEDLHIGRAISHLIERALAAEGGHGLRTAKRLGVNESTLWRWRKGYKPRIGRTKDYVPRSLTHYKIPERYAAPKRRIARLEVVG